MRIVHIQFAFDTGGIETMLVDILNRQCQYGETWLIIINDIVERNLIARIDSRVNICFLGRKPGARNPLHILRLNFFLRQIQPDIVHLHDPQVDKLIIPWLCKRFRTVLTAHDIGKKCGGLNRVEKIFAISRAVKNDLSEREGFDSTVIENGIDFSLINRKISPFRYKGDIRLIQVSRLRHEKKGQHLLIEAVAILRKKYGVSVSATFVGEGPSLDYLKQFAENKGVPNNCVFTGLWTRKKIYENLADYDILVQPSLYEGFGLTVIEGVAAGLPVVASDRGGCAEVLNGKGWLFKTGDSGSLAETIMLLVSSKQKEIAEKINEAYEYAKKNYDIEMTVEKYLKEYQALASE